MRGVVSCSLCDAVKSIAVDSRPKGERNAGSDEQGMQAESLEFCHGHRTAERRTAAVPQGLQGRGIQSFSSIAERPLRET